MIYYLGIIRKLYIKIVIVYLGKFLMDGAVERVIKIVSLDFGEAVDGITK